MNFKIGNWTNMLILLFDNFQIIFIILKLEEYLFIKPIILSKWLIQILRIWINHLYISALKSLKILYLSFIFTNQINFYQIILVLLSKNVIIIILAYFRQLILLVGNILDIFKYILFDLGPCLFHMDLICALPSELPKVPLVQFSILINQLLSELPLLLEPVHNTFLLLLLKLIYILVNQILIVYSILKLLFQNL